MRPLYAHSGVYTHTQVCLALLVHRTSRGRARMALHGEQGYRQRVGVKLSLPSLSSVPAESCYHCP